MTPDRTHGSTSQSVIRQLLLTGASAYAYHASDSFAHFREYHLIKAVAALLFIAGALRMAAMTLRWSARKLNYYSAAKSTGLKGTASWLTIEAILKLRSRYGLFLGCVRKDGRNKGVIHELPVNTLILGNTGSGKNATILVNSAMTLDPSLGIVWVDLKQETVHILSNAFVKQGRQCALLDLGNLNESGGEFLNPLDGLSNLLWAPGGLRSIIEVGEELVLILYEEPPEDKSGNEYFRQGARELILLCTLILIILEGNAATLGDVGVLLNDHDRLTSILSQFAGKFVVAPDGPDDHRSVEERTLPPLPIENEPWCAIHSTEDLLDFLTWLRSACAGTLSLLNGTESRAFESFYTGAKQSLSFTAKTTHINRVFSKTTIDLNDLKNPDNPLVLFIGLHPSNLTYPSKAASVVLWVIDQVMKSHPDLGRNYVQIHDEATTWKIPKLLEFLTFGRSFGQRNIICFQSLGAFRRRYGEDLLRVLLSETGLKILLPMNDDHETNELWSNMLGDAGVMSANFQLDRHERSSIETAALSEESRPLAQTDEIRLEQDIIVLSKGQRPYRVRSVRYAAIDPYRDLMEPNLLISPNQWRLPVELRMTFHRVPRERRHGKEV